MSSTMVPVSENGEPVQKSQSIDKEASLGNQQLTGGGQGSSSKHMMSTTIHKLSDLPDGLLQDVLSYLFASKAVRTSILSLRWCEVWKAVPGLQAHCYTSEFKDDEDKFNNFVTRLLRHRARKAPLKAFSIYSTQSEGMADWINYAIQKSVESLEIGHVTMMEVANIILSKRIKLCSPHLKILALYDISLASTHLSQLNNHCPNLRILKLEEGEPDLDTLEISSSSLTKLCIKDCSFQADVLISAPNLTLLRFINSGGNVVSLTKLPLLEEASVVVLFHGYSPDDPEWGIVENYKYSILRGLSHAKTIEINAPIREPLVSWKELLRGNQMFSNLTTLVLDEWCMADLYPIAWFMKVHLGL